MAITPTKWNPSDKSADITLSGGDLIATCAVEGWTSVRSLFGTSSGKWYWEITIDDITNHYGEVAVGDSGVGLDDEPGVDVDGYAYRGFGDKMNNDVYTGYGDSFAAGDVISVALDMDAGKIWWGKDGVWQASGNPAAGTNEAYSGIVGTFHAMICIYHASKYMTANFGASAFSHSVPSGFTSGFGGPCETTEIIDLSTEIRIAEKTISDLLSSIIAGFESLSYLKSEIDISEAARIIYLKSEAAADFLTNFANLSIEISAKAQQILNLFTEIKAGNQVISDLISSIAAIFGSVTDLKSEIQSRDIIVLDLYTAIRATRESLSDVNSDISVVIYPTREKFLLLRHDHIPVRNEQNVPMGRAMQFCLYNPDSAFGIDLTTFKLRFDEGVWYRYGDSRFTFTQISYREYKVYFNPPNFLYDREIMIEVYCEDHRNNPGIKLEIL